MTADADVALVVNPAGGQGRAAALVPPVVARLRAHGVRVRVLQGRTGAQTAALCRDAVGEAAAALVVLGGDGTVHAGLQAVAGTPTPLGVLPAGTGNDVARALGVPDDPVRAADGVGEALRSGSVTVVDAARVSAGHAGERPTWFAGVLSAGFDSAVTERANRLRWPRGRRRYDVAIFAELARLRARELILTLDGSSVPVMATFVAVGNTSSYGGGMKICPRARPDDGLLDVTVVGPISRAELVRVRPRVYLGTHVDHPAVTTYRARRVGVAGADLTAYADGERLGPLPVQIECVPAALRVLEARKGSETDP